MRQIVLDTETTGLSFQEGHRVIEIGCVEMINRRLTGNDFHEYLNPGREIEIEEGALQVHGITQEFLQDKPSFAEIADRLLEYLKGAELIIHNSVFDVGFLDYEYQLINKESKSIAAYCNVIDTLIQARQKHPGQPNNLDALCKRYHVDNSDRRYHGALLDARLLADVYLAMTGGQSSLFSDNQTVFNNVGGVVGTLPVLSDKREPLRVIMPSELELNAHQQRIQAINQTSHGNALWVED